MKRFTEKYVRAAGQWVKITRDNEKRTFTFARGYENQFQASSTDTLSFKWIANWSEANDFANQMISNYA